MNITTAKKCNSRDAATATLRKLGVAKADYDDYICKKDGIFYVDVNGAGADLSDEKPVLVPTERTPEYYAAKNKELKAMITKPEAKATAKVEDISAGGDTMDETELLAAKAKAKKTAPKAKVEKAKRDKSVVAPQKGEKETVAEATRRLLLAGKSNGEVWEELVKLFPTIDEKKKQFPAWYRFDMKKKGQLV